MAMLDDPDRGEGGGNLSKARTLTAHTAIIGFDSAWVDKPTAPGAVCALHVEADGSRTFVAPCLASFSDALAFIEQQRALSRRCLVALDQPTIVPNHSGCRPVDRVAGSLIAWLGGGVQPANRSKQGMFDDAAPVWRFKSALSAIEDPEQARRSEDGLFLIEVFPALALPSLDAAYFGRQLGPRYNPGRRKTFKLMHWTSVLAAIDRFAAQERIGDLGAWATQASTIAQPKKADQDRLDAVICAVVGYCWLVKPRSESIMIGDREAGYMIAPASADVRAYLTAAAVARGVPINGFCVAA